MLLNQDAASREHDDGWTAHAPLVSEMYHKNKEGYRSNKDRHARMSQAVHLVLQNHTEDDESILPAAPDPAETYAQRLADSGAIQFGYAPIPHAGLTDVGRTFRAGADAFNQNLVLVCTISKKDFQAVVRWPCHAAPQPALTPSRALTRRHR